MDMEKLEEHFDMPFKEAYNNKWNICATKEWQTLTVPPIPNTAEYIQQLQAKNENGMKIDFDHGTTTLGFQYKGGIVLGVDSRSTCGHFVGSRTLRKIVEVNDFLLSTLAGCAADGIYWDRKLTKECRLYELDRKEPISLASASKILQNMMLPHIGKGLTMGMILAGYDKRGGNLYYVDSHGIRTPGQVLAIGSGSVYAYGVLDSEYAWDMSDEQAYELAKRSIHQAICMDALSGGLIRVYHMTSTGWKHVSDTDYVNPQSR